MVIDPIDAAIIRNGDIAERLIGTSEWEWFTQQISESIAGIEEALIIGNTDQSVEILRAQRRSLLGVLSIPEDAIDASKQTRKDIGR